MNPMQSPNTGVGRKLGELGDKRGRWISVQLLLPNPTQKGERFIVLTRNLKTTEAVWLPRGSQPRWVDEGGKTVKVSSWWEWYDETAG